MSRTFFVTNNGELYSTDVDGVTVRVAQGWELPGDDEEGESGLVPFNGKLVFAASQSDPETENWLTAVFSVDSEGVLTQLTEPFTGEVFLRDDAATAGAIFFKVEGYYEGYKSDLFRLTSDGTVTQLNATDVVVTQYIFLDGSNAAMFMGESEAGTHLYKVDAAGTVSDLGETSLQYFSDDFSIGSVSFFKASEGDGSKLYRLDSAGNLSQVGTLTGASSPVLTDAGAFLIANDETGQHLFKIDAAGNATLALEGPFYYFADHAAFNGTTYFGIADTNYVSKLYAIDASGAVTLASETITNPWAFTEFNGGLYFAGLENGTPGVFSLTGGTISPTGLTGYVDSLTAANGKLYAVMGGEGSSSLHSLDASGSANLISDALGEVLDIEVLGESLYLVSSEGGQNANLYKVDSTGAITLVRTANDVPLVVNGYSDDPISVVNGALVFAANDGSSGFEPWTINAAGDVSQLGDFNTSALATINGTLDVPGGKLVFTHSQQSSYTSPFLFADASGNLTQVKDSSGGLIYSPNSYKFVDGTPYVFAGDENDYFSNHIYKIDETGTATQVDDDSFSYTQIRGAANGALYFTSYKNSDGGYGFYKIDNATGATSLVQASFANLYGGDFPVIDGVMYLLGDDGGGSQLFRMGSDEVVTKVSTDNVNGTYSFQALNGSVYFIGSDSSNQRYVYRIDDTGTMSVFDSAHTYPNPLNRIGDYLYYSVYTQNGYDLYKIDGTGTGTLASPDAGYIHATLSFGGATYLATDGGLYTADAAGDLTEVSNNLTSIYNATEFGGAVYFPANGETGSRLYKLDDQGSITLVSDAVGSPQQFLPHGGTLYVTGYDASGNHHLYKLDGTGALVQVDDATSVNNITSAGDEIYFTTSDGTSVTLMKIDSTGVVSSITDADFPAGFDEVTFTAALDAAGEVNIFRFYDYETNQDSFLIQDATGDFKPFDAMGNQGSNPVGFTFLQTVTNHAPVAVADVESAGENEATSFDVMDNDTDEDDGDTLTLVSIDSVAATSTNAAFDDLDVSDKFTIVNGEIAFVPGTTFNTLKADEDVTVTIGYTIEDAAGEDSSSTLTLTIEGENDAATARANSGYKTTPGVAVTITKADLLGNDSDIDGDTLTVHSVQGAQNGTVKMSGGNVIFTPGVGYAGPASFTYTVSDGNGSFSTAKVSLDVKANAVSGDGASNVITGTSGADQIDPGLGSDFVEGLGGNDIFMGRLNDGNDYYSGGAGVDTYNFSNVAGAVQISLTEGTSAGAAGSDFFSSVENVIGGAGADTIDGSATANSLVGGAGADKLNGFGGRDKIEGGRGNDIMSGGGGIDTFVFGAGFGRDRISDFTAGGTSHDALHFSRNVFSSIADVLDSATQSGDNVVIKYDANNYVVLEDLKLSALKANAADDIRII